MSYTLTADGQAALDLIPEFLHDEPTIRAIVGVQADEFADIAIMAATLRDNALPFISGDPVIWEALLELTVGGVPGQTPTARRGAVLNALVAAVTEGSGEGWEVAMGQVLGGSWSYEENANQVRLNIPFGSGTPQAVLGEAVARAITPAHVDVLSVFSDLFVLGQDRLGQDTL